MVRSRALVLLAATVLGCLAALPVAGASAAPSRGPLCDLLGLGCPPPTTPPPTTTTTTPTTPTTPTTTTGTTPTTTTTSTTTTGEPPPPGRNCLAAVGDVSETSAGPMRIGDPSERLRRRARVAPTREVEGVLRYCVKSGGRIDVVLRRDIVSLLVVRAQGYRYKKFGPGDSVSPLKKGAKGARKSKHVGFRIGNVLVGEDKGFVEYVAPTAKQLIKDRDALRRSLGRAGV